MSSPAVFRLDHVLLARRHLFQFERADSLVFGAHLLRRKVPRGTVHVNGRVDELGLGGCFAI